MVRKAVRAGILLIISRAAPENGNRKIKAFAAPDRIKSDLVVPVRGLEIPEGVWAQCFAPKIGAGHAVKMSLEHQK